MSTLTLAGLRRIAADLAKHALPKGTVKSDEEAAELTRTDPRGHVWAKGEEYYIFLA